MLSHIDYQDGKNLPTQHEKHVVETGCSFVHFQALHKTPIFAEEFGLFKDIVIPCPISNLILKRIYKGLQMRYHLFLNINK